MCFHTFPAVFVILWAFLSFLFFLVVTLCVFSCRVLVVELICDEALSLYESFLESHSSDLTVAGTIPNTKDLGKSATLNYAIGSASGKSTVTVFLESPAVHQLLSRYLNSPSSRQPHCIMLQRRGNAKHTHFATIIIPKPTINLIHNYL